MDSLKSSIMVISNLHNKIIGNNQIKISFSKTLELPDDDADRNRFI